MTDIFDTTILCRNCNNKMHKTIVNRNGFELRAVECRKCGEKIIHPADLNAQEHFRDLKGKTFSVKLRMVGNSHAISIPKEILDFMNEQHRHMRREMDEMVKLCFENFDTLRLKFGEEDEDDENDPDNEIEERIINRRRNRRIYGG